MDTLSYIKDLLSGNRVDKAIKELERYIKENPTSDEAYYLLGNAYRKTDNWKQALTNYSIAKEINPDGPGAQAYEAAVMILDFYNTDLYNP